MRLADPCVRAGILRDVHIADRRKLAVRLRLRPCHPQRREAGSLRHVDADARRREVCEQRGALIVDVGVA